MSELDIVKERNVYLRFWLGIMVLADISLFGLFVLNAGKASMSLLVVGCCLAVDCVTLGIITLYSRIERRIETLGEL